MKSALYFVFQLTPWDACLNLNFLLGRVGPFSALCIRDQLVLIGRLSSGESFDELRTLASRMASGLVEAHAFFCAEDAKLVEVTPVLWIQNEDAVPERITIGYLHPSATRVGPDQHHPDNRPFEQACQLLGCIYIGNSGHPRIGSDDEPEGQALVYALADFWRARRDLGAYSAFHAFRALENLQYAFPGHDRKARFNAMNSAIGSTEADWAELTKAGKDARHLEPECVAPLQDVETRKRLLETARRAIELFVNYVRRNRSSS